MNKKFKGTLASTLTVMLVILSVTPSRISLAAENKKGDSQIISKDHILYLKSRQINVGKMSNKLSNSISMTDNLEVNNYSLKEDMKLYIIAFNGPVEDYMKEELKNLGVELVEYIPDFAFLVRMNNNVCSNIEKLSYINNLINYDANLKIDPFFKDASGNIKKNIGIIKVETFNEITNISDEINTLGGIKLEEGTNEAIIKLNYTEIEKLADLNSVKYIEPVREDVLFNDVAKGYMNVDPLENLGYTGSGQIVGICDTGLDTGINDSSMHLDFQGRINSIYALGRSTADDLHGHGTHVAGSVLGNGAKSNGQFKGTAPNANLVFQSVLDYRGRLSGIPSDLKTLFEQARKDGARIHTNSWGSASNGEYTGRSRDVDEYIWKNNDMIILFAAGNEGLSKTGKIVYNTIGSPSSAKNCITVGASENYRPEMGDFGDNPNEVVGFSSRGNCSDGRIKPDIVAPGSWILSTKSSKAPVSNFWKGYNDSYAYMGGTSMATPLTAGAVAVAREYMEKKWNHTPSAAMMKAAIINGGTDLGYGYPSKDQGWGRVSLKDSLASKEYKYEDNTYSVSTGQNQKFTYSIESSKTPLKVSLVWSDYPGSITASKALVNDLDIKITSPTGKVYYGNDFDEPYNDTVDHLNNVENIFINNPEVGDYTVEVTGYNVPQGPQSFALFSSADFGKSDETPEIDDKVPSASIVSLQNNQVVNGTIAINAEAQDNKGIKSVEFYVDDVNIGTATQKPYTVEWNTKNVKNGSHTIKVKAIDTSNNVGYSEIITINVENKNQETVDEIKTFTGRAGYYEIPEFYIDVTAKGKIDLSLNKASGFSMELYDQYDNLVAEGKSTISYNVENTGKYKIVVYGNSLFSKSFKLKATYPIIK